MTAPKPIVIALTKDQQAALAEHYARCQSEAGEGRTGMLIAQVGWTHGRRAHDEMRVVFMGHQASLKICEITHERNKP